MFDVFSMVFSCLIWTWWFASNLFNHCSSRGLFEATAIWQQFFVAQLDGLFPQTGNNTTRILCVNTFALLILRLESLG